MMVKTIFTFLLLLGAVFGQVSPNPTGTNYSGSVVSAGPNPRYDVTANGALCDGVTNDSSAINTLMAAIATAGGGIMGFPSQRSCAVSSTITWLPDVQIRGAQGSSANSTDKSTLLWTGAASGVLISAQNTAGGRTGNDWSQ